MLAKNNVHLAGKIKPNQISTVDVRKKNQSALEPKNKRTMNGSADTRKNSMKSMQSKNSSKEDGDNDEKSNNLAESSEQLEQLDTYEDKYTSEFICKEDIDMVFDRTQLPSLMLTKLKIKRSKQAVQDAFSVLNQNMVLIDSNQKDLLYLV